MAGEVAGSWGGGSCSKRWLGVVVLSSPALHGASSPGMSPSLTEHSALPAWSCSRLPMTRLLKSIEGAAGVWCAPDASTVSGSVNIEGGGGRGESSAGGIVWNKLLRARIKQDGIVTIFQVESTRLYSRQIRFIPCSFAPRLDVKKREGAGG